ncbi:hypothetical protein QBC36DRAFT_232153 [Triangularia setosa]|uniref:RRM domain-containing protein n=1 Tax=Triangularia setosa TaxID=2587417 RepID=A0AAN6WCQ2_9PEZI|nr:hypothetical protein QBC36DRAFT_232153 [Podospora setosa]
MSEQSPEIVAAANLSPLSPKPISVQIQSSSVVPMLQDQAATTDTAGPSPADPHQSEPMTGVIMDPSLKNADAPAPVSDTIVVAGDSSDFHDDSDSSIDYGEEDESGEKPTATADATADAAPDNDEYAKSFDSPVDLQSSSGEEAGAGEPQPDVSEEAAASISMNEQVTPAPAAIAHLSDRPPPPTSSIASQLGELPNANGWSTLTSVENEPPTTTTSGNPNPLSAPVAHPTSMLPTPNPNKSAAADTSAPAETANTALQDEAAIQKLVDDITARATATATATVTAPAPVPAPAGDTPASSISAPLLISGPHPPSLPPKPLISAQSHAYQRGPNLAHSHPLTPTDGGLMHHHNTSGHGSHRHSYDLMEPAAPAPASGYGGPVQFQNQHVAPLGSFPPSAWETFLAEERQYTSEQNWDKFPEGSRVFVGNLSSDRVSKQQVFAVFSKYGRLAQISMKSAYGFVQYHTVSEAQAALEACQDMEIGGRRIHLEISRRQKKKAGDERGHSPDRRPGPRGMTNDRYDANNNQTRDASWKRNDYRRSASPRRDDPRAFYPRERDNGPTSHDRRRSRSPPRRNRFGSESYRRRSPSPHHRRTPSDVDLLDIPRRYGNDVPDIQILLLQNVDRPFVDWVQNALHVRGLKTAVMHLNPHFPRDTIVQRQVLEGVHAIIDLDHNSPLQGKVNLQLFIRSTGNNIRFENYSALDPPIAAELVIREKSRAVVPAPPPPVAAPSYPPTNYQPPAYQSNPVVPQPLAGYPQQHQQPHYPAVPSIPQAAPSTTPDLSKIDNDTLRTLLASLQPQAQHQQQHAQHAAPVPQIDINALLGSLQNAGGGAAPPQYGAPPPPQAGYYSGVPPPPAAQGGGPGPLGNNTHIQNIMENLKRASGSK